MYPVCGMLHLLVDAILTQGQTMRLTTDTEHRRRRYDQLVRLIGAALRVAGDADNVVIQGYWEEMERIKAHYGGFPPPVMEAE
jgi:hypothetical protein